MLLVYVDDILITSGNKDVIKVVVSQLNNQFALKDLGPVNFYLSFEVIKTDRGDYLINWTVAQ